jgi:hypothetical protein
MAHIIHHTFKNPDNETDWEKEAFQMYHYLLKEEERNSKETKKLMETFKRNIEKETNSTKKKILFDKLKLDLLNLRHKDDNFERMMLFILLITKAVNEFQNRYEKNLLQIKSFENMLKIPMSKENQNKIETEIKNAHKALNESFNKYEHRFHVINRTEMFRSVNAQRLDEFRKDGYQFKTNYMIDDSITGDDSRYFNSLKQVRRLDEDFEYTWKGQVRRFPYPIDRPNDRQILIPFIS